MQLGSNFRLSSIGLNSGPCDWLGLRHQSRVCTENLQLTGAKSPPPKFGGMRRNSPDISKGLSLSGMWGFDPWMVSQAVHQLEIVCAKIAGCLQNAGFLEFVVMSLDSEKPQLSRENPESLRPIPKIFPFSGDLRRRPFSIRTAW